MKTTNILTKSNISKFAKYILTKINSAEDFSSCFIMTTIFTDYSKINNKKFCYEHNIDEDELAEQFFTLSIHASRHAEKILASGLRLC